MYIAISYHCVVDKIENIIDVYTSLCHTTITFPLNTQESSGPEYHQIFVQPEGIPQLQVTFDDNKQRNFWSYHPPPSFPHITGITHFMAEDVYYSVMCDTPYFSSAPIFHFSNLVAFMWSSVHCSYFG